jgi:hypothetical protein
MLQVDRFTKMLLSVIAAMLVLIAVGLWVQSPKMITPAYAGGIPDSGQQLDKILVEVEDIQQSVDKLSSLFLSGKVKVQLVDAKGKPVSNQSDDSTDDAAGQ